MNCGLRNKWCSLAQRLLLYSFFKPQFTYITSIYSQSLIHQFTCLPIGISCQLLAQLVERCTGCAEVMGSNPYRLKFFSGLIFTAVKALFITYCEDCARGAGAPGIDDSQYVGGERSGRVVPRDFCS